MESAREGSRAVRPSALDAFPEARHGFRTAATMPMIGFGTRVFPHFCPEQAERTS